MEIMDRSTKALALALNFRQKRQDVISANIANSETPGYKAKRLDFEDSLARALNTDGQQSLKTVDDLHYDVGSGGTATLQPKLYDDPNGVVSEDGNTVDRESEMVDMAENKIMYDAAVQALNKKIGLMKYAISAER